MDLEFAGIEVLEDHAAQAQYSGSEAFPHPHLNDLFELGILGNEIADLQQVRKRQDPLVDLRVDLLRRLAEIS